MIMTSSEKKHEVKTDCFAYEVRPIRGGSCGIGCKALKKMFCKEEDCSFYKPRRDAAGTHK